MASFDSSEPVIQLNNLYDEIHVIEEEMKNNSSKMINLIKSNKLKKLYIKINDYVELKIILQFEYPKVSPNLIQILYSKLESLDYESEEFLDGFFKRTNLALNTTIDRNHGKCCVYKIYKELKEILSQNQDILIHLNEIHESYSLNDGKDDVFNNLINKKIIEKKNQDKKQKTESENEGEKAGKFKGSDIIFQRLKWDESIDKKCVIIGYLDRFKGVMEIKFNDFKGVHDDYKEGIPLHRIRYYKICDKIVWDREKKIDLLTGSNLKEFYEANSKNKKPVEDKNAKQVFSNMFTDAPILKYNSLNSIWSEESNSSEIVSKSDSEIKILTYNVLSTSNFKHSIRYANEHGARGIDNIINLNRNSKIIECLVNSNADIIALQECDVDTENQIKDNKLIQEKYFICSTNHINDEINCLILTKFIPNSYKLLKLTENSPKCALIIKFKTCLTSTKQVSEIYISNIHLTSDKSTNSTQKRRKQLESLTNHLIDLSDSSQSSTCFICGDFNTSNDVEDQEIIKTFLIDNQFVDLAPHSNTFDPNVNFTAALTSSSNKPRRYDRLYMRVANKTEFLVKSAQLLNSKPLEFDKNTDFYYEPYVAITSYNKDDIISLNDHNKLNFSDVDKSKLYMHPSDHYALKISISFKNTVEASNLSHKAALAIVLPKHSSRVVQNIRKKYDRTFNRWPPHINLLYPFFETMNTEIISKDLSHILSKYEPFTMDFNQLNHFAKNCVVYMEPNKQEADKICKIQADIRNFFSELADSEKLKASFTPHMTISQPDNRRDVDKNWSESMLNKINTEYGLADSFEAKLPVDVLYWLTRSNENEPFVVQHTFPIGKYLPPIHLGIENSKSGVIGFLTNKNLIGSLNNSLDNNSKLLLSTINSILKGFNSNGCHYDTPNTLEIHPIGSYCFGTKYSDIDMIVLKQKPNSEFNNNKETHEQFIKDLAKLIAVHQDDFYIVRVINDAYVPIIEITLNENSKTYKPLIDNGVHMIDIQIYEIPNDDRFILSNNHFGNSFNYMKAISNDYTSISRLSAIFENDNLKHLIKYYKDFQILLSFVKYWAESKYIYGKAFGYIGGISYAIMCIYFLKQVEDEFKHVLEIDNSNSRFIKLIIRFFTFYSTFNWHENYISLIDISQVERETKDFIEYRQKTAISVLQSVYPYENLTRNIKENGKKAIKDEFKKAHRIIDKWQTKYQNDLYSNEDTMYDLCKEICSKYVLREDDFKNNIKFQVHYNKNNDICHIFSIMKSKTQGLVGNLERILEKKHFIRVLPELESVEKIENSFFNKIGEYTIGIKYDSFDKPIEEEIQNLCQKFCTNVSTMCYTSEFEIKIIKNLS